MRTMLLVALFLVKLFTTPQSVAEPGPIEKWLMNQPMSLWDWGMFRTNEIAELAAGLTNHEGFGSVGGFTYGGANYDWESNEIEMWMAVSSYPNDTSHKNCNKVRRIFIGYISASSSLENADLVRERLHSRIDSWFSHLDYRSIGRDEKLGEKISRIVFVKVRLSNDGGLITCRERIMVFEAPSKPGKISSPCDPNGIFYDILKDLC